MTARGFDHAVVLGSGIAGLVTARVLSDFFGRVTVIERDASPGAEAPRPGVPQGAHFHALLPGGLLVLKELFPRITSDLRAGGSLQPAPSEFYFFRPEGKSYLLSTYMPDPPPDTGQRPVYVQSRAMLEGCIRRRVEALPNVTFRYRARATDILGDSHNASGVRLESGETISADLVIDALGRGGRTLEWLETLGYARPAENTVRCDLAYTSVFIRPRDPSVFKDVGFFAINVARMRAAGLVRLEHDTWVASVSGSYGDYPPHDLPGFMAFARTVEQPLFDQLMSQTEPLSEPAGYRFNRSVRRRFELLTQFPEGLLPIGDAVCNYNPVYGQGMSAACRQAMGLWHLLSARKRNGRGLDGLWREFLPQAFQETRSAWLFAALADFRDGRCTGDFPVEEKDVIEVLQYLLTRASVGDSEALNMLLAIQTLIFSLDVLRQPPWTERAAAARAAATPSA